MNKKPYENLGDHIETGTKSISQLVDSLGSFKKIINTIFLLGSVGAIGFALWAGYRYVEVQTTIPNTAIGRELLAKSTDGNCFFYKWDNYKYTVEYFSGYDLIIQSTVSLTASFSIPPSDIKLICERLKMKQREDTFNQNPSIPGEVKAD